MQLTDIRKKIDHLDYEVVALLNRRMELALRAQKLKQAVYAAEREQKVIQNVRSYSRKVLRTEFTEALYRAIMAESRQIQGQGLKLIGFQGEHGAFSEAASSLYDAALVPIPCREFADLFDDVTSGRLDYGIVPVENSSEGSVNQVTDLLIASELTIVGEIGLPVHHCLLALPETDLCDLRTVYSHPQALGQCRAFLAVNRLSPKPFYDTAGAAQMLAHKRLEGAAVIAGRLCATLYGLEVVRENIEDHASNTTRFVVLAREALKRPGTKCSIAFSIQHEIGTLAAVLQLCSAARINLTRIESRPEKNDPGKYVFLIDFEGCDQDRNIIAVLGEIKKRALMYKYLGCYQGGKK